MGNILFYTHNYSLELLYTFQVVLLLLLAEAMASKHVPLNQTPEYDAHRYTLLDNNSMNALKPVNFLNLNMCCFWNNCLTCIILGRTL